MQQPFCQTGLTGWDRHLRQAAEMKTGKPDSTLLVRYVCIYIKFIFKKYRYIAYAFIQLEIKLIGDGCRKQ